MTGPDDTPAALPRRPDARTFSVEDLVLAVLSGQIRVPNFQRGFRWEPQDALDLLDSIDRGYPIGTLLLWQRPARDERLVHGSVVIDAPARQDALWVVDGQQRISSLTRVFAGKGHPDEPFAAFYDLKTGTFKLLSQRKSPAPHELPLTEVLDSARLVEWLVAHNETRIDRQAAIALGKRLREYQVFASIVATEDERTVREIFRRANRTGKRLVDSEVFHGLYSHDGPAPPTSLRDVAHSLDDLAFGPLDEETLLSMLLATRGPEIDKDRVPELKPAEAHRAMIDLERSARAVITFLRHDAGIPHVSLLPFRSTLPCLARFFHHHPEPHPRSRELLVRWLWRGAVNGTLAPSPAPALAAIDSDEHATLQRLLQPLKGRDAMKFLVGPHSDLVVGAFSRLHMLAMLELEPRDLRTGERVVLGPDMLATADPYRGLVQQIVPDSEDVWSNQLIHRALAGDIIDALIACEDPAILASHAILPESWNALRDRRHQDFLTARRLDVFQRMLDFVERRAEWGEPDTPPVEALQVQGD